MVTSSKRKRLPRKKKIGNEAARLKEFGRRLKEWRLAAGLTQEGAAAKARDIRLEKVRVKSRMGGRSIKNTIIDEKKNRVSLRQWGRWERGDNFLELFQ